jgi:hypothetical protein
MTEAELRRLQLRKAALLENQKTTKQVFVTLVTPLPAKRQKNYLTVVDNELNLECLFG